MKLRIRDLREDNDYSQKEIANYLKCDKSLYSKYERNKRDIPLYLLIQLADLYNESIDYIIGRTNNKNQKL